MREYRQNLALQVHLQKLREESPLVPYQPTSPETTLISRYVGVLGPEPAGRQPFEVLGTWIQSIPSRIGSNKMLDLAVQFFVDSHATYRDDMHSKRKVARASKAKALKELQLAVMNTDNKVTDVMLSPSQRASMAVMHVFIQCPYAVALIREAISNPEDTIALAIAMSYLEGLMQINVSQHVAELIETTVSVVPIPPSPDVADLMPDTLEFNSMAIAPWHRMTRDLTTQRSPSASPGTPSDVATEVTRAKRMQAWIVNETNKIHKNWNVATVDEEILIEALEALSGEKMPDWLPTRVRFVPEEGEMALHMEFENRTGTYSTGRIDLSFRLEEG
ncbi:uncharacterized protein J4E92_008126 [Alternaria infectoria]|uniref:uncharacterized protein n=1 Tax=Alternaria infectoria TaxID=45303 RepID=UPI0022202383|nr:uncharacterized protein J4E92_008126 [Alternaria infectoria]KAI4921140.1 hypothetical protein J4E92_008126 [Alternaria infectoria]